MKKVTCINCGFLCWDVSDIRDELSNTLRYDEVLYFWRNEDSLAKIKGILDDNSLNETNRIKCLRNQWIFSVETKDDRKHHWANANAIASERQCVYYAKYQPGFSPDEHKELQREANTTRTIRNATLWGAAIGAIAAIIAQLLYVIITR
jgi:hypothetical protein